MSLNLSPLCFQQYTDTNQLLAGNEVKVEADELKDFKELFLKRQVGKNQSISF